MAQIGTQDRIREQADEVAALMAERFGGARAGLADLPRMMRIKGAALPRRLRREGAWLAEAATLSGSPRIARQLDTRRADKAYRALTRHLRPLGEFTRLGRRSANVAATVMAALLVVGGLALWYATRNGLI